MASERKEEEGLLSAEPEVKASSTRALTARPWRQVSLAIVAGAALVVTVIHMPGMSLTTLRQLGVTLWQLSVYGMGHVLRVGLGLAMGDVLPNIGLAVSLDAYPLATCLDGSSARYYLSPGSPTSTTWLIFHEGGGGCGSEADCRNRALTRLGSTRADRKTLRLDGKYYFRRDPLANPLLSDAHHVFVRYCDGGLYSGERREPLSLTQNAVGGGSPSASRLFFRGRFITEAIFADLRARYALDRATDVVLAGCSAGAIHLFAHIDALRALLPRTARVAGFADSGFYLDTPLFTALLTFGVAPSGHNATALLGVRCRRAQPHALQRCLVPEVNAAHLRTPLFAFQSRCASPPPPHAKRRQRPSTMPRRALAGTIRISGPQSVSKCRGAVLRRPRASHSTARTSPPRYSRGSRLRTCGTGLSWMAAAAIAPPLRRFECRSMVPLHCRRLRRGTEITAPRSGSSLVTSPAMIAVAVECGREDTVYQLVRVYASLENLFTPHQNSFEIML